MARVVAHRSRPGERRAHRAARAAWKFAFPHTGHRDTSLCSTTARSPFVTSTARSCTRRRRRDGLQGHFRNPQHGVPRLTASLRRRRPAAVRAGLVLIAAHLAHPPPRLDPRTHQRGVADLLDIRVPASWMGSLRSERSRAVRSAAALASCPIPTSSDPGARLDCRRTSALSLARRTSGVSMPRWACSSRLLVGVLQPRLLAGRSCLPFRPGVAMLRGGHMAAGYSDYGATASGRRGISCCALLRGVDLPLAPRRPRYQAWIERHVPHPRRRLLEGSWRPLAGSYRPYVAPVSESEIGSART